MSAVPPFTHSPMFMTLVFSFFLLLYYSKLTTIVDSASTESLHLFPVSMASQPQTWGDFGLTYAGHVALGQSLSLSVFQPTVLQRRYKPAFPEKVLSPRVHCTTEITGLGKKLKNCSLVSISTTTFITSLYYHSLGQWPRSISLVPPFFNTSFKPLLE